MESFGLPLRSCEANKFGGRRGGGGGILRVVSQRSCTSRRNTSQGLRIDNVQQFAAFILSIVFVDCLKNLLNTFSPIQLTCWD